MRLTGLSSVKRTKRKNDDHEERKNRGKIIRRMKEEGRRDEINFFINLF